MAKVEIGLRVQDRDEVRDVGVEAAKIGTVTELHDEYGRIVWVRWDGRENDPMMWEWIEDLIPARTEEK